MEIQSVNDYFSGSLQEIEGRIPPVSSRLEYLSYSAPTNNPQPYEIIKEITTAPVIRVSHSERLSDSAQTEREKKEILENPRFLRYAPGRVGGPFVPDPYIDSEPTVLDNGKKQYIVKMGGTQYFFRVDVTYRGSDDMLNSTDYTIEYHDSELPQEVLEKAAADVAKIPSRPLYDDKGNRMFYWDGHPPYNDKGKRMFYWE